jgi:hypothetical protein
MKRRLSIGAGPNPPQVADEDRVGTGFFFFLSFSLLIYFSPFNF